MEWSLVLYAAIGGSVGGVLGKLIAIGINKKSNNDKYHKSTVQVFTAGLAVFGVFLAKSLYADMLLPRLGASLEQQILDVSPIYVEMKKYEPEYFDRILAKLDKMARKGTDEASMINESRLVLVQLLLDKSKYADEDALTTMMEIALQNYSDYKVNKPYLCILQFNQRGLGDIAPYVSDASLKLEEEYTLKMIRLPKIKPILVDAALAEKTQQNMLQAFGQLLQPGENMDPPPDAPLSELKRVCDVGAKLVELMLVIPKAERANYIRNNLGQ